MIFRSSTANVTFSSVLSHVKRIHPIETVTCVPFLCHPNIMWISNRKFKIRYPVFVPQL
ncbi:hypothetical protein Hanom_Chr13g01214761 [Helianthus anomalus]